MKRERPGAGNTQALQIDQLPILGRPRTRRLDIDPVGVGQAQLISISTTMAATK